MHGYLIGAALTLITVLSPGWDGNSAWPVSRFSRWRWQCRQRSGCPVAWCTLVTGTLAMWWATLAAAPAVLPLLFFRDPDWMPPSQDGVRDGAVRIGISMNLADFQINSAPVADRVRLVAPVRGTFGSLRKPEMLFSDERLTAVLDAEDLQVDLLLPDWADIKVTAQAGDQLTAGRSVVSPITSKHGSTGRGFPERDAESHHSVVPDHPARRAMGGLDSGG